MLNDIIDKKIFALFQHVKYEFNEEDDCDVLLYLEMRDFAEMNDGLLFQFDRNDYIVIHSTDGEFFIAEVDYSILD